MRPLPAWSHGAGGHGSRSSDNGCMLNRRGFLTAAGACVGGVSTLTAVAASVGGASMVTGVAGLVVTDHVVRPAVHAPMPDTWDDNAITLAWLGHASVLVN